LPFQLRLPAHMAVIHRAPLRSSSLLCGWHILYDQGVDAGSIKDDASKGAVGPDPVTVGGAEADFPVYLNGLGTWPYTPSRAQPVDDRLSMSPSSRAGW